MLRRQPAGARSGAQGEQNREQTSKVTQSPPGSAFRWCRMRSRPTGSRIRGALKAERAAGGRGEGLGWSGGDGRILASLMGDRGPLLLAELLHKAAKGHVPRGRG